MRKILFDTDVLIDFLRGLSQAIDFIEKNFEYNSCHISVITIAELYAGVKGEIEKEQLKNFFECFNIEPVNPSIAIQGGLYRNYFGKSHSVGIADALIAATAIEVSADLITLNKKHFPMLADVEVPYHKSDTRPIARPAEL